MTDLDVTPTASPDQHDVPFARLTEQVRRLLDAMAAAAPDPGLVDSATAGLSALADLFDAQAAPVSAQVTGRLDNFPGRGQALVPPLLVERSDDDGVTGTVRFGRFHHGSDGTVHGGAIALFLEEVLGFLAVSGRTTSRTAFLHVDYRSSTPIDSALRVEAWFEEEEEGRKRFLRATLHDRDVLCVEARALCVALRTDS
jgi:acyl-coenzyme A thioesterase PaaI-like protein